MWPLCWRPCSWGERRLPLTNGDDDRKFSTPHWLWPPLCQFNTSCCRLCRLPFLPLDPGWPPQRVQQVCEEARPAAVLWSAVAAPGSGGHGPPPLTGFPLVELPPLPDLLAQHIVVQTEGIHGQQEAAEQQPGSAAAMAEAAAAAPQLPYCYVLFTSGSTGRPLGVCGTDQGVLNRCRWMQQACPFQVGGRGWRAAQKHCGTAPTHCSFRMCVHLGQSTCPCCGLLSPCSRRRETGWHSRPPPALWTACGKCLGHCWPACRW